MFKRTAIVLSVLSAIVLTCSKNPVAPQTAPVITLQPQSQTVVVGDSVEFIVAATGNPLPTYQWQKNGVAILGETNAVLFNDSIEFADTGIYTVVVSNSKGNVTSNPATLTVTPIPPSAPTLVLPVDKATSISVTPTVKWSTSAGTTAYRVQVSADSLFSATPVIDDSNLTSDSLAVTSPLADSTTYYWRVNAKNSGGTSRWSSIRSFTTVATLSAPSLFSPSNGATAQPLNSQLIWTSVIGAAVYHVQVSTSSSFTSITAEDSMLTIASTTILGLAGDSTYYWRVRSRNASSTSPWSSVWSFTTVPFSGKHLTLLYPTGGSGVQFRVGDTVRIRWSLDNSVSSVVIWYSLDGGTTFPDTQIIDISGSIFPPDTEYLWTIDSTQVSNQFVIKIRDYINPSIYDTSSVFAVISPPAAKLKINNNEVTGWTIQKSGVYYTVDSWASPTGGQRDGESYHYTVDPGLTLAAVLDEMMSGPNGASVTMYVIDYSNVANSATMFNYSKTHSPYSTYPEPLTQWYSDTVAVGENSHDGISVCAHFKQFYIELRFTGYTDFSLSKQDAIVFLQLFETKINGMLP